MKKIYPLLLTFAAGSLFSLSAQQLPNNGFEEAWSNCVPWTSKNNTSAQGTTPAPWLVSNTVGTGSLGKTTVASKVAGHTGSNAVELKAGSYSGKNIPGYMSLGTAWSTAQGLTGGNADGGTFGGTNLACRPDAVSFYYKRDASSEKSTIVVYSWKGTTTQANVPGNIVAFGNPTKVTMTDRERNILGMETSQGGTVSKSADFELIASNTYYIEDEQSEWTNYIVPLEYYSDATPQKFNVIFAAGEYFESSPKTNGKAFTIDDVKLAYFSRLSSLTVNGKSVTNFDSETYEYTLYSVMPEESAFEYTFLGNSGMSEATLSLDRANNKATVTVTNKTVGGEDIDGETSHVYTINFRTGADVYIGDVTILAVEAGLGDEDIVREGNVKIYADEPTGKCTFVLPDFALTDDEDGYIGDIVVPDVNVTEVNGEEIYEGIVKGLKLNMAGSEIICNVTVDGVVNASGTATMNISVIWLMDPENDPEGDYSGMPINVLFNGQHEVAGIEQIATDLDENAPVEIYNVQGIRVDAQNMTPGIYILRQGNSNNATKVLVK